MHRFGVPAATNAMASKLVEALTRRALEEAAALEKALHTLSPDRVTPVHPTDLAGLLQDTFLDADDAVRAAWNVAQSRCNGVSSSRVTGPLPRDLVAFGFKVARLPVCRTFWNRASCMAFCETLGADASGSSSQAGLPPGA
jgi:hypothetical protein